MHTYNNCEFKNITFEIQVYFYWIGIQKVKLSKVICVCYINVAISLLHQANVASEMH